MNAKEIPKKYQKTLQDFFHLHFEPKFVFVNSKYYLKFGKFENECETIKCKTWLDCDEGKKIEEIMQKEGLI